MVADKHQTGTGTFTCSKCGDVLTVNCLHEFADEAYCETCEIQYVREREPVADAEHRDEAKTILVTPREEKPEYEEYYCEECERMHENTSPTGEWTFSSPEIVGYDEGWIVCPCGERHSAYVDADDEIECRCGREYTLSVDAGELPACTSG